jgi:superfamily II DNA/RNA helicase/very-short-patch-repair endonuclease
MDIFAFQEEVVDEYKSYVQSFIDIRDDRIRSEVENALNEDKKLWPEPLVQFNPAYQSAGPPSNLVEEGLLHPGLAEVFYNRARNEPFQLYRHQEEALRLGVRDENFVVTSGTGSGKSLTYLGTIFDSVFRDPTGSGIRAIIIYPMNALINSQVQAIEDFRDTYERRTGQDFPVEFAQYTGQTDQAERERICKNPPHVLLTNYMMMELIMTRQGEARLRESLRQGLKYLVYDELHTYRGRQGADVGLLNRRLHEYTDNELICIGTSATMAAGDDALDEQRRQVAEVAEKIFGRPFEADHVIGETLTNHFEPPASDSAVLREAVQEPIDPSDGEAALKEHPLAGWLEHEVGLAVKDDTLVRREPLTLPEITDELAEATGLDEDVCSTALTRILRWVETVNRARAERDEKPLLPFKLHQFIAQTGSVYVTLEERDERTITLDAGYTVREDDVDKPIFPVAFSRLTGHDFLCVTRREHDERLVPRDFHDVHQQEEDGLHVDRQSGYVLLDVGDEPVWREEEQEAILPKSWFNRRSDGTVTSIKKDRRDRVPQKIYFDVQGTFSTSPRPDLPYEGWWVPAKLPLDPTAGVMYNQSRTSEFSKLAKLGSEARSTATSVLSRAIVRRLESAGVDAEARKVLSFTDNRQDASLQAGHFNDFNQVIRLRSAIYQAARNAPDQILESDRLARSVFDALDVPEKVYARNPIDASGFSVSENKNRKALKKMIFYRALDDLRRSWRIVLPNLEQCALLEIGYKELEDIAAQDAGWAAVDAFADLHADTRLALLTDILNYFRTSYALEHVDLEAANIDSNTNLIRNRLTPRWGLDSDEEIQTPKYAYVQSFQRRGVPSSSIGYASALGKHLRRHDALEDRLSDRDDYHQFMEDLLGILTQLGYLSRTEKDYQGESIPLYRLQVDRLLWKAPNEDRTIEPYRDDVRMQAKKDLPDPEANDYFQEVYASDTDAEDSLAGAEHTGQIQNSDRQAREEKFRDGRLQALFCSPTMELGIDIKDLAVVHMRNVPPNPANYAQRSGRAGRVGQAALAVTYCANSSSHDRHYFQNQKDMVAGVVTPPRLDLKNEELLRSHLHALYLSEVGLGSLQKSIKELLDLDDPELPLRDEVRDKLQLSDDRRQGVAERFRETLGPLRDRIERSWYTDTWIQDAVRAVPDRFDDALDRWRSLYRSAVRQRDEAQKVLDDDVHTPSSDELQKAEREEKQARRQIRLLTNEALGARYYSEFYPFRYLASEGFLPGYNFTRLPIRAYMPIGDGGEYISRPREIALREFGPRNRIYHNGSKFEVNRLQTLDLESNQIDAKVSKHSGYFLSGDEFNRTNCPFTGTPLNTDTDRDRFPNLLELSEVRTYPRENITCEEEERSREGYEIDTYFSVDGPMDDVRELELSSGDEPLLSVKFVPTARLYFVNQGWRYYDQEGFMIDPSTGTWNRSPSPDVDLTDPDTPDWQRVKLYTSDVADALYIHPSSALDLDEDGVLTLQYALQQAIIRVFQVEPGEIQSTLMGEQDVPNLMIYEAAEGSLGILSQIVEVPDRFREVVNQAYDLCHFNENPEVESARPRASYDDLLSYYNQYHHERIDRRLIRDALEMLRACELEVQASTGEDYDAQFQRLLQQTDPNSTLEDEFLQRLHERNLRLPDVAQWSPSDLYVQPDFYYEDERVAVFVDGSPHDEEKVRERDTTMRRNLRARGYRVIEYHYSDDLDALLDANGDVFRPVR